MAPRSGIVQWFMPATRGRVAPERRTSGGSRPESLRWIARFAARPLTLRPSLCGHPRTILFIRGGGFRSTVPDRTTCASGRIGSRRRDGCISNGLPGGPSTRCLDQRSQHPIPHALPLPLDVHDCGKTRPQRPPRATNSAPTSGLCVSAESPPFNLPLGPGAANLRRPCRPVRLLAGAFASPVSSHSSRFMNLINESALISAGVLWGIRR